MHTLGLEGNYAIPQHLQAVISDYGLRIQHLGDSGYRLESVDGDSNIDNLCPSSIERDGNVFDLTNLRRFANFLHQPIKNSIADEIPEAEKVSGYRAKSKQKKTIAADVHEGRAAVHRMLRFAVTGSVEIPPDEEENLDKETAECHAITEQAVRDGDTWLKEVEFGNTKETISSIPNTSFDPKSGFRIQLPNEKTSYDGASQQALNDTFWQLIKDTTDGKYNGSETEITLSGAELEKICHAAEEKGLNKLINHVEFEEAVQEKLASIKSRVTKLSSSALLGRDDNKAGQLHTLMGATSALTPVISSGFMRDAWARYNFTHRHDSPLEGLDKEMAAFMAVADLYSKDGQTSPVQMEAIATEFYNLIAFSSRMASASEDGLSKQALKDPENPQVYELLTKSALARQVFNEASVAGVDLNASFLNDEQRDALVTLQKRAGRPQSFGGRAKSAIGVPLKAGADTTVDFAGDVVNFIREDPKIAVAYMGLAAKVVSMNGGNSMAAQREASYSTGISFDENGNLVNIAIDATNIPKDIFAEAGFHWDLKLTLDGYEMYKHFANANFIVGPSQTFMEGIRGGVHAAYTELGIPVNYDSAFDNSANAVINPLAEKLFAVNMFQNFSHVAFWMWTFSKGWNNGLHGYTRLFELASPINDLIYQGGAAIGDKFKKQTALSERLLDIKNAPVVTPYKYDGKFEPADLVEALAAAAEERAELEATLPENIQPIIGAITIDAFKTPRKLDGLTREFKISAENFKPTLGALNKFDHFMSHVASSVAANETWHIGPMIERIKIVQDALKNYARTGDTPSLNQALDENLEYIMASELRYRGGKSNLYEALFEASPDKQAFKRLMRSAHTTIGKEKRANGKAENRAAMRGEGEDALKLTGHMGAQAKILGTNLWGGMVSGAKTLRRGTDRTVNKRNIIIAAGVATVCSGLDLAGAGNAFTDAVSGLTGGTIAAATTVTTFLNFNFWEDIVGVHLGTGFSLLFAGAASGYAYKKGIRPAIMTGLETTPGSYTRKAWGATSNAVGTIKDNIAEKIDKKNTQWGDALTERALRNNAALSL